jgi:colanic acid biosynthesis glycosyl transferase WcaI
MMRLSREPPVDVLFFNTFEEPISFFEVVMPRLADQGTSCAAILSQGLYRSNDWLERERTHPRFIRFSRVPARWRDDKRVCALLYWMTVPHKVLFSRAKVHVFLSEPPMFYFIGVMLSVLRRKPAVVVLLDLQFDVAASVGLLNKKSPVLRVVDTLSTFALRRSQKVIVLGRCMLDTMIAKGVPVEKLQILQLWSPDGVTPIPEVTNQFLVENDLQGKFIVLYSGNMGLGHEFATILEVAASMQDRDDLLFVFIGNGSRREQIADAIRDGTKNIRLVGFQDRSRLSESLSAASVHFVALRPGCEGLMVPSKFYGAIATARPVIFEGAASSEIALSIHDIGCGEVVDHRDVDALRRAILRYYDGDPAGKDDGVRALAAYENSYTEAHGAARVVEIVRDALSVAEKC